MPSMFEIRVPDAKILEFERRLGERLAHPTSVLQAIGGQRYLLADQVAKALFPGASATQMRAELLAGGAREARLVEGERGVERLVARAEPAFVPRFMA
ncbi:MAG: hypothetical protein IT518_13435, partial [Burkholderiales bacterium]|nr:hypothetical protein [Burkholderiales bacterium]